MKIVYSTTLAFLWGMFFLLVLPGGAVHAQSLGNLNGIVRDSVSGEAIAFATVYIPDLKRGATTNDHGFFVINGIPAGKEYSVRVACVGYITRMHKAKITANADTKVVFRLVSTVIMMPKIEKIGEKQQEKNSTDLGLQRVSIKEMEMLPKGVEMDVFRSLRTIPGVQSTGDASAKYYVRGGASNQNLVLLDGVTIYNPFHALGMASVIDPELINSIEFYKSGFPTEYSSRLSSILNIVSKKGNANNFSGKAAASFLSTKGLLEGPLPFGSFIMTGRKSTSSQISNKFFGKNIPFDFYDYFFRVNYDNQNDVDIPRFSISGFFSNDKLINNDPYIADFNWANNMINFTYHQLFMGSFIEVGVSSSNTTGEVKPNLSSAKPKSNSLNDLSIKVDMTRIYSNKNEIRGGLLFQTIKNDLYFTMPKGIVSTNTVNAGFTGGYLKFKLMQFEDLGIDLGSRFNLAGLNTNGGMTLEPRISVTYRPHPLVGLKAAYGEYQQEMTTTADENEVVSLFEPWVIIPEYMKPSRAKHYTGGVELNATEELTLTGEIYLINQENVPSLNFNKLLASDPDFLPATQESYGLEGSVKYQAETYLVSVGYSLSYAYKVVEGWRSYPRYDSRNNLNISIEKNFGDGWTASVMWLYNSGSPFTQMVGFYDKMDVQNLFQLWVPYEAASSYGYFIDRNLGRLPDYHRMDVNVSKKFDFGFARFLIDFNILNVYNRKNLFYFERQTGKRVNMLPILPTVSLKAEF
ncbi:MAG: TonB-dependent receptor [Ignavibacteria bacterium]|nr:TonB-dependent receptor [Ignavibacteria bacterium]